MVDIEVQWTGQLMQSSQHHIEPSAGGGLDELQVRLRHRFGDVALLRQALTHRSFSADHNERLELLGDSVLNLAVSHFLFERLGGLP